MIQPKQWPSAVVAGGPQSSAIPSPKEQPKAMVSFAEPSACPQTKPQPTAVVVAVDSDDMAGGYSSQTPTDRCC
jgi:hypothetical protein